MATAPKVWAPKGPLEAVQDPTGPRQHRQSARTEVRALTRSHSPRDPRNGVACGNVGYPGEPRPSGRFFKSQNKCVCRCESDCKELSQRFLFYSVLYVKDLSQNYAKEFIHLR